MNQINRMSPPPTHEEALMAEAAIRTLSVLDREAEKTSVIVHNKHRTETDIPAVALELLKEILSHMAQGRAITIFPHHAELTTQEAASILNVSRPYVIKLIDNKELNCTKIGKHRRIRFDELMVYKTAADQAQEEALDELTALSQELGIGYD